MNELKLRLEVDRAVVLPESKYCLDGFVYVPSRCFRSFQVAVSALGAILER